MHHLDRQLLVSRVRAMLYNVYFTRWVAHDDILLSLPTFGYRDEGKMNFGPGAMVLEDFLCGTFIEARLHELLDLGVNSDVRLELIARGITAGS